MPPEAEMQQGEKRSIGMERVTYSRWSSLVNRVLRPLVNDKIALLAAVYVVVLIGVVVFASDVAPYEPTAQNLKERFMPPAWAAGGSTDHLLGTDTLGRDILSRLIYGARTSLIIGLGAAMLGTVVGSALGLIAGYLGGRPDAIIMRAADVFLAFPVILLTLAVVVMIGPSMMTLILVFGLSSWVIYARVARSVVLSLRESQFVQAARAIGCSDVRIILFHLVPNSISSIISLFTVEVARHMVGEAGLSFVGLGIQPPDLSWGLMLAEARDYLEINWWAVTFPGMALAVSVLCISLIAVWGRAMTDPFQRQMMGLRH